MKKQNDVPRHIGFILDGNRRYAKKNNLIAHTGHQFGAENVENLFHWIQDLSIPEITLYSLSTENLKRSTHEVNALMGIFDTYFQRLRNNQQIHEQQMRVTCIGRKQYFPEQLQETIHSLEEETKEYDNYRVNFALGYSGRTEIVDGIQSLINDILENKQDSYVTESVLTSYMQLTHEPDLIIRTGGDYRTSNFLMWQSPYSEWFFVDTLWPEFTKQDLEAVISSYETRDRRFGK